MTDPLGWLHDVERERIGAGLRRSTCARQPDGPALLDLAGNDYLGLARDPRVVEAAVEALRRWGAGSTGSRLVTGTTSLHDELEAALALHTGFAAALVFSSGYLANLGALTSLAPAGTRVVCDALNHASLIDAARLARGEVVVVPHLDLEAVADALSSRPAGTRALVVTDAVFSVDGDAADLAALHAVVRRHEAALLVDDAHGVGVVGEGGRGSAWAAGIAGSPDVVVTATLSKALGSQGGVVLGSAAVRAHVLDQARTFIFDTGLAPASAAAALAALHVIAAEPDLPARVREGALALAAAAREAGWRATTPSAAVASVLVGEPDAALAAQRACAAAGVAVGCFRPPSVPDGVSRLRLAAHADLSDADLALAAAALAEARHASR